MLVHSRTAIAKTGAVTRSVPSVRGKFLPILTSSYRFLGSGLLQGFSDHACMRSASRHAGHSSSLLLYSCGALCCPEWLPVAFCDLLYVKVQ